MPVHGEYRMLKIHAQTGVKTGVRKQNTFVLDNGDVLAITKRSARIAGKVQAGSVYIDGQQIGEVGSVVIRDRKHLSDNGLLSAVVTINQKQMKRIGKPVIISRGFIHMKEETELIEQISNLVEKHVQYSLEKY